MSFEEAGFLSKQAAEIGKEIHGMYKKYFDLCCDINRFAEKVKNEFEIHSKNGQEVITACLFIRLLESYQAATLLIGRGFDSQVKAMIRMMLETLIVLKLCCVDKEFVNIYVKKDEKDRHKIMNVAHRYDDALFAELREYATDEVRTELKKKIEKEGISDFMWEDLAHKADMIRDYDTVYRLTSMHVHANPRNLEAYLDVGPNGEITSLNHTPHIEDTMIHLLTSCDFMARGLEFMLQLYDLGKYQAEMLSFFERFKELHRSIE